MNNERLMKILLSPLISEKGTSENEAARHYIFKVLPDARKREIGRAVEKMFEVQVESVRVLNVKGKRKRVGTMAGRRKNWRKAYVRLKQGYDIEIAGGA
jgi:large subunit ribosomal protein L23